MISGAEHDTARAGVVTVDAVRGGGQTETAPEAARLINSEIAGPAQSPSSHGGNAVPCVPDQGGAAAPAPPLNAEADMIRFIDSFWAHLADMRRPEPTAQFHRLTPGTAECLRDQCRIEHARLVVLDAQRGAEWLGKSRKEIKV